MFRPTIRQLEYLIALEREMSFSKAALSCNVTQSTLSAGIRDLENILEHPLVIRTSRSVNLSALGAEIVAQARGILRDVDLIVARAQETKPPMSGVLRLGVIPTIAPYFLPEILPHLKKDFPSLELELYEDFSDRLIEKLRQGTMDAVIMAFPFDIPHLEYKVLFEESFLLACPKGTKPNTKSISISGLDAGELLLLEDGHCLSDHALSACGLQKPEHRKAYSATSLPTLIQMVSNGFGMTLLPEMVIESGHLPENIDIIPFDDPCPTRQIGLARKVGTPRYQDTETLFTSIAGYKYRKDYKDHPSTLHKHLIESYTS